MAEWTCAHSLVTPAGTITFNAASGDAYQHDPLQCSGLDGAPLRVEQDPASLTDGGLLHTTLKGARHITLGGMLVIRSVSAEAAMATARTTLEDSLSAALDSIANANGVYSWTPTGKAARSLTVRYEGALMITGSWLKSYLFGLVAANPTIT